MRNWGLCFLFQLTRHTAFGSQTGNVGPFDDTMGEMGALDDVMINWDPLIE